MKVAFVTFGCRLNRAESLDLEARYRAAGHEIIAQEWMNVFREMEGLQ